MQPRFESTRRTEAEACELQLFLVIALAIHASPAFANEAQTLTPAQVATDELQPVPLDAVDQSHTPPQGNAWAEGTQTQESSVIAKVADGKVCVVLKASSFEVKFGDKPERRERNEPAAYLICDNATTNSGPGGVTTLKCTNCSLTLPNGAKATANEIAFDSKSSLLTLVGTEEKPVVLTVAGTISKAPRLEMTISPEAWAARAPALIQQGAPLSVITTDPSRSAVQPRY
jgi:hypothetical protein